MKPGRLLCVLLALSTPLACLAQSEAELQRYAELDRRCEAARARKLEPIREKKIAACVKDQRRTHADCEGEFAAYGNTHGKAGGGAIGGMYYDLPECQAATAARNSYRQ